MHLNYNKAWPKTEITAIETQTSYSAHHPGKHNHRDEAYTAKTADTLAGLGRANIDIPVSARVMLMSGPSSKGAYT